MPIFRSGKGMAPAWCEMEYFEIVHLQPDSKHTLKRLGKKEKLIVAEGQAHILYRDRIVRAVEGTILDLFTSDDAFEVVDIHPNTILIRMCGRWGEEIGGCGLFALAKSDNPQDCGDPVSYLKETNFDSHYHDCDEYWIILAGRGIAVTEGKVYTIEPGDCVATGRGHHHDIPQVFEPIKGVYFETTLEKSKRTGHLWEHTHGEAQPDPDRI